MTRQNSKRNFAPCTMLLTFYALSARAEPVSRPTAVSEKIENGTSDSKDWEQLSDKDGITNFVRRDNGTPSVAFRGFAVLDAPVLQVVETIIDTDKFKEWMTQTTDMHVLKKLSDVDWVVYDRVPVAFPFQDRDFIILFHIDVDGSRKSVHLTEKSYEDPDFPISDPCCVRGRLDHSIYNIEPRENGTKSLVNLEVEFDPAGNLPKWLVKAFLKDTARKTLTALRSQVAKDTAQHNPKLEARLKSNIDR